MQRETADARRRPAAAILEVADAHDVSVIVLGGVGGPGSAARSAASR